MLRIELHCCVCDVCPTPSVYICQNCKLFFNRNKRETRMHKCRKGDGKCYQRAQTKQCTSCRLKRCREVGFVYKEQLDTFRIGLMGVKKRKEREIADVGDVVEELVNVIVGIHLDELPAPGDLQKSIEKAVEEETSGKRAGLRILDKKVKEMRVLLKLFPGFALTDDADLLTAAIQIHFADYFYASENNQIQENCRLRESPDDSPTSSVVFCGNSELFRTLSDSLTENGQMEVFTTNEHGYKALRASLLYRVRKSPGSLGERIWRRAEEEWNRAVGNGNGNDFDFSQILLPCSRELRGLSPQLFHGFDDALASWELACDVYSFPNSTVILNIAERILTENAQFEWDEGFNQLFAEVLGFINSLPDIWHENGKNEFASGVTSLYIVDYIYARRTGLRELVGNSSRKAQKLTEYFFFNDPLIHTVVETIIRTIGNLTEADHRAMRAIAITSNHTGWGKGVTVVNRVLNRAKRDWEQTTSRERIVELMKVILSPIKQTIARQLMQIALCVYPGVLPPFMLSVR